MSSSSPVSSSPKFTLKLPEDPSKENSTVNKTIRVIKKTRGFEVSPETQQLLLVTQVAPFSPPTPSPSPSPTFSLLGAVRKYNADNPGKAEADTRSPSPLVNEEQETKLKESRDKALKDAVCSSKVNEVSRLIKQGGVDLLQVDQYGKTLLHMATSNNSDDIAKALLSAASELLNTPSVNLRRTPLHLAAKHGFDHMVTLLLSYNPALDSVDLNGNTPLHLASRSKDITVYDKLVSAGADTSIENNEGILAERPLGSARIPIQKPEEAPEEESIFNMTYIASPPKELK